MAPSTSAGGAMDNGTPTWGELAFFFVACCGLVIVAKLDSVRRALGL